MGQHKHAPWGFECPYQNACPHLRGRSATWVSLLLADRSEDLYRDSHSWGFAQEELRALDEENRALSARVEELESRLKQHHRLRFKPNRKKTPAAPEAMAAPVPRKRGAPVGHPAWQRPKPDRVDRRVEVSAPTTCPHCKTVGLSPVDKTQTQVQEDIVLQPRTVITEYLHHMAYCPECRREVFQTDAGELRNCEIGPITQAAAVYLRHEVKLSYRDARKVFAGFFGMSFVPASAMAFSHRAAERGASLYEDLRNKIQASSIAHGDETHWRIDGQSGQLWYAGNPQIAFFHADRSRGSDVATSIFGTAFSGHFIGDSYAAYNAIHAKRRQVCLAHLIRKTKEISERIELMPENLRDPQALRFCRSLGKLFSICCRIDQRRCRGSISFDSARRHIPRLQRVLTAICWQPLQDEDAENLRQRVSDPKRDAPYLFTFLETQGVPPTNNHAEQSLRLPVIFRKISFGSRSLHGAQALAVNLSFLATAHRQNRSPIELFRDLLLLGSDTPLSSLYNPASLPVPNSS